MSPEARTSESSRAGASDPPGIQAAASSVTAAWATASPRGAAASDAAVQAADSRRTSARGPASSAPTARTASSPASTPGAAASDTAVQAADSRRTSARGAASSQPSTRAVSPATSARGAAASDTTASDTTASDLTVQAGALSHTADATVPSGVRPSLRFGYGTNGLADLRLDDALSLLADLGYDGVGLTLDHMHLDPLAPGLAARTRRVAHRLDALGLGVTVETGARYVLDPRRKHGPSLLDPDPDGRARRTGLLTRAVQVAADLGAHAVHCFSGIVPEGTDTDTAWKRLAESLTPVLDAAASEGIPLAVEPEPGHLLATLADFHHLRHALGDPEPLGLTLDIGHCQCLEPLSPADCVRAAAPWLRHVQIEDMRRGVHEHLPFGEGEIDFPPVLAALAATGYQGLTVVELPRHSHAGPHFAAHSLPFLRHAERSAALAQPGPAHAFQQAAPPHGAPSTAPEGSSG